MSTISPKKQLNWFLRNRGFTLVETVIVIGILVIITFALNAFLVYTYRTESFSLAQILGTESARRAVKTIGRELKEAIQGDNGNYLLIACGDDEIIFYSDIDKDDQVEKVRYYFDSGEEKLFKNTVDPSGQPPVYSGQGETKTVSSYVKNTSTPVFYCYDQTYSGQPEDQPLTTPVSSEMLDEVTLIGFKLLINADPIKSPRIIEIESKAQLRNAKQNP